MSAAQSRRLQDLLSVVVGRIETNISTSSLQVLARVKTEVEGPTFIDCFSSPLVRN
jgi:hypothetical protein